MMLCQFPFCERVRRWLRMRCALLQDNLMFEKLLNDQCQKDPVVMSQIGTNSMVEKPGWGIACCRKLAIFCASSKCLPISLLTIECLDYWTGQVLKIPRSCRTSSWYARWISGKTWFFKINQILSRFTDKDRTDSWLFGRGCAVLFVWSGCQFFYLCRWKVSGLDGFGMIPTRASFEWFFEDTKQRDVSLSACLATDVKNYRVTLNVYDAYRLHARKQKVKPPVTVWLFVGRQMFRLVEIPFWNVIDENKSRQWELFTLSAPIQVPFSFFP